jgi:hypothetical protein
MANLNFSLDLKNSKSVSSHHESARKAEGKNEGIIAARPVIKTINDP